MVLRVFSRVPSMGYFPLHMTCVLLVWAKSWSNLERTIFHSSAVRDHYPVSVYGIWRSFELYSPIRSPTIFASPAESWSNFYFLTCWLLPMPWLRLSFPREPPMIVWRISDIRSKLQWQRKVLRKSIGFLPNYVLLRPSLCWKPAAHKVQAWGVQLGSVFNISVPFVRFPGLYTRNWRKHYI